ncbi:MAG: hypothetical protein WC683_00335 [bacterium]
MTAILSALAILWCVLACLSWDMRGVLPITVRPDDVVLVVMAGLILFRNIFSGRIVLSSKVFLIVAVFVAFLMCASFMAYLLNTFFDSGHVTTGTFGLSASTELLKEYVRLIKYVLVVYVFSNLDTNLWRAVIVTVTACCGIIIVIQLLQYFQVEGVNEALELVYGDGEQAYEKFLSLTSEGSMEMGHFRSGSIFGNPNVLGAFLVAPVLIVMMRTIEILMVSGCSVARRAWAIIVTIFLFLGVFMTQSRAALIASLAAALVGLSAARKQLHLKIKHVVLGVAAIIVLMSMLVLIFSGGLTRYTSKFDGERSGEGSMSVKSRLTFEALSDLEVWQFAVGEGPAQSAMVDNEVGYMLLWYGFTGLVAFYMFYFVLYKVVVRRIDDPVIQAAFTGVLAAYLFLAVSNSVFLNIKVFPIFLALLAVAASSTVRFSAPPQPSCA